MLEAIICDLDGTVLDNESIYGRAFSLVLKSQGVSVTDPTPHIPGIGMRPNWQRFLDIYSIKTEKSIAELGKDTQDAFLGLIDEVHLMPGFVEFANQIKGTNIRLSLATSNSDEMVEVLAKRFSLKSYFEVIVTSNDVSTLKPDPGLFLLTANKLGVHPAGCVVIEDAYAGVVAAQRAGMKSVGISTNKMNPDVAKADLVVTNFYELALEDLRDLVNLS